MVPLLVQEVHVYIVARHKWTRIIGHNVKTNILLLALGCRRAKLCLWIYIGILFGIALKKIIKNYYFIYIYIITFLMEMTPSQPREKNAIDHLRWEPRGRIRLENQPETVQLWRHWWCWFWLFNCTNSSYAIAAFKSRPEYPVQV